jgi:hypothetical protein
MDSDAKTEEDWKDLYYAMCQTDQPALQNWQAIPNSGRYTAILAKEKSLL